MNKNNEGLTNLEAIAYLSTQPERLWDIVPHKEKRSLNQNAFYHMIKGIIAKAMLEPPAYVHNFLLRRTEIFKMCDGEPERVLLPDTDKAEEEAMYDEVRHRKPVKGDRGKKKTVKGDMRWYMELKGTHEMNTAEMSYLIDIALNEMENMGLMLPKDAATMKAYEEHKKHSTQIHEV